MSTPQPVTEAELLEYLGALEAELAHPQGALAPRLELEGRSLDPALTPQRAAELAERLALAVGALEARRAELATELRDVARRR